MSGPDQAGAEKTGDIYDRKSPQKLRSANCSRFIFRLQFAANAERQLITCEAEPMLWDTRSARNVKLPACTPKSTVAEAINHDGQFIALQDDENNEVTVVNVAAATSLKMANNSGISANLVFSPDSKLLAGSSPAGNIVLWDISSGRVVRDFSGHAGPATALAFSADGKLLASGGADQLTKIWTLRRAENN